MTSQITRISYDGPFREKRLIAERMRRPDHLQHAALHRGGLSRLYQYHLRMRAPFLRTIGQKQELFIKFLFCLSDVDFLSAA